METVLPADANAGEALLDGADHQSIDTDPPDDLAVDPEAGKPREACGVFGVYAPGQPVAHLAYLGIYALQHRGQESAGIASSDGNHLTVVKEMGLVSNVFDDRTLAVLDGDLAIGHTRYSTTGSSMWKNSQPLFRDASNVQFALAHNGNLVNTAALAETAGMLEGTVSSDTDAMAEVIAQECDRLAPGDDVLERALMTVLPTFEGAFSLVLMDRQRVIGLRDPRGFLPLCLGKLDSGWVLASETPAQAYSRILYAAMDSVASEFYARLVQPPG